MSALLSASLLLYLTGVPPSQVSFRTPADVSSYLDEPTLDRTPPDIYLNSAELIRNRGYGVEEYDVITEDGYILKLTRILGNGTTEGTPVLVLHGIFVTSTHYLHQIKERNLVFLLADAGYDVWMGDLRGNMYTRTHLTYSSRDPKFWNFSFHEMGMYDVPAMMDRIRSVTGRERLHYVGHSMGTTVFLVTASKRPEYGVRIAAAALLAPISFAPSPYHLGILRLMVERADIIYRVLIQHGVYELLPWNRDLARVVRAVCSAERTQPICIHIVDLLFGENRDNWDLTKFGYLTSTFPAGSSAKALYHFGQIYKSNRFSEFDYGRVLNKERYGNEHPPEYNLGNITTAVGLYYGVNDRLMDLKSADALARRLPNLARNHVAPDPKFCHYDFLVGANTKELIYDNVIGLFDSVSA